MPNYFSSEQALKRMKLFFTFDFDLMRNACGFVPKIPGYDDKCQFVRHVYEDLKRCRSLRERVQDFGIPNPENQIQPQWSNLVNHLMIAPNVNFFVGALYRVIKVEQCEAYKTYIHHTLRLNDSPSVEALEDHLPALERQIAWGKQFMEAGAISCAEETEIEKFETGIRSHIQALGGLYAAGSMAGQVQEYPDFVMPANMELESRFTWRSVDRIYDALSDKEESTSHHSYTHFTELPVIDLVAAIVYDGKHMGFEYVADFTRQCWDEARHSMMGFSRLRSMGIDPYSVPIPVGTYSVYLKVPLLDRIAALTQVGEACSFAPKKIWTQWAEEHGDLLTALEHDFDIVDEKNHVKFGSKWMKAILIKNKETRDFKQIVQDAEWTVRGLMNDMKKEWGEKWQADLGPRFEGCQTSDSPLNLAPTIFIA